MSNNYKIETKCIQSGWQPTKGRAESFTDLSEYNF